MSSFFDDDDDEDISFPPTNARASSSRPRPHAHSRSQTREPSIVSESSLAGGSGGGGERGGGSGSRSFLSRLESTISPQRPRPGQGHPSSYTASESIDIDSIVGDYDDDDDHGPGGGGNRRAAGGYAGDDGSMGGGDLELELEEEEDELDDVKKMGKVLVKERGTVDIQGWEGDLIDTLFDKLEQQQKMVDTLRSDPQTSEEEHFKLVLVQTEMERVKYLIRSYVRTRLHKIEKYAQYIFSTPALHPLLSGAELSHAKRYMELLHTHFQHSVLDSLPEWLRGTDDTYADGLSMVTKPNKDVPILIYCRKDCGEIMLEGVDDGAVLSKGTTHLVKYNLVERFIGLGWAEVL